MLRVLSALCTLVLSACFLPSPAVAGDWMPNEEQKKAALDLLAENYVTAYDRALCDEYAWRHLMRSLTNEYVAHTEGCPEFDPFTFIFPPEATRAMTKEGRGEYIGLGLSLASENGTAVVKGTMLGSPAEKAGIVAGDIVRSMRKATDGQDVEIHSAQEVIDLVGTSPGTEFMLRISRGDEVKDFVVKTDVVKLPTVSGMVLTKDLTGKELSRSVAYIAISQFSDRTADEVESLFSGFRKQYGEDIPLLLDVRNNPGGILNAAIELSYLFADDFDGETMIVRERAKTYRLTMKMPLAQCFDPPVDDSGRSYPPIHLLAAEGDFCTPFKDPDTGYIKVPGRFGNTRIALLINNQSASASEWTAAMMRGALREKNRTRITIIGTHSFGKGIGQAVVGLPSDTADTNLPSIHITTMEFRSATDPDRKIHGVGIEPDITIELGSKDYDLQVARALEVLLEDPASTITQ